jgi:hypothetical protein
MFRDEKRLKQQFLRMYSAMESRTSRLEAEALFFELVELLLKPGVDTAVHRYTSPESARVRRTRDYIAERSTESISLAELGRIADLSPFHLHRLFSQQTGIRHFCGSIGQKNFLARVVRFQTSRPQPDSPTRATSRATSGGSSGCLPAVIQRTSSPNRKNVQDATLLRPTTFS